jgi:hypothetical protein
LNITFRNNPGDLSLRAVADPFGCELIGDLEYGRGRPRGSDSSALVPQYRRNVHGTSLPSDQLVGFVFLGIQAAFRFLDRL